MSPIREGLYVDQTPLVRLENAHLQVDVAPSIGGRIVSLLDLSSGHQFLWRNRGLSLQRSAPGSPYDPNFYGGIDELLPGDLPETINGIASPDHGELWTTALDYRIEGQALVLWGRLPLFGLACERRMALRGDDAYLDMSYRIRNDATSRRQFMWKHHAALEVEPGEQIECPARMAQVADLRWSRWRTAAPFAWPVVEGQRADLIPVPDGTTDFLYLYDLSVGRMSWLSPSRGMEFSYVFDTRVFPYTQYFASFGGLDGHFTAVLEPCTAMPISVNEAARLGQCSVLEPGESIVTRVTIYAGKIRR